MEKYYQHSSKPRDLCYSECPYRFVGYFPPRISCHFIINFRHSIISKLKDLGLFVLTVHTQAVNYMLTLQVGTTKLCICKQNTATAKYLVSP